MIDLHVHTQASNGQYTAKEIINKAIIKNISTIAITDHDSIEALDEAIKYTKNKNINVISGIELSTSAEGQLHILGIDIDYKRKELVEATTKFKENRQIRNERYLKAFKKIGMNFSIEDLRKYSYGEIVTKSNFAYALCDQGYVESFNDAFKKYFYQEPLRDITKKSLSPRDTIELIKRANGLAILAHPQTLGFGMDEEKINMKIQELKSYGLDGMECYHSKQTKEQMEMFKKIAKRNNLIITKGSDFHGPSVKPDIELGVGINGNIVNSDEDFIEKSVFKRFKI